MTMPAASTADDDHISDADLQIPLGDAPVPARGGQPCPPGITPIRLSIAETARLAGLAAHYTAGLITRARLAFALRWSAPATAAPGHRPLAPLQRPAPRRNREPGNQLRPGRR